jgi:excisionase family DNA binding protein
LDKINDFAGLKDKMNKILITKEVAEMLRVSEEYVRELIRQRKLKAYKEGRRGGFRITMGEIEKYINRKHKEMARSRK